MNVTQRPTARAQYSQHFLPKNTGQYQFDLPDGGVSVTVTKHAQVFQIGYLFDT
jgi:hypothetical protein